MASLSHAALEIPLPGNGRTLLACGSDSAGVFCLTHEHRASISPNLGNLSDYANYRAYCTCIEALCGDLGIAPAAVAHDLHPDYVSTRYAAERAPGKTLGVQHHHAHIAAVLADHERDERVIGVAFDGTGYGPDGTVWGGEFLVADCADYRRVGRLKQYRMPGGDEAVRCPYRMAISCLRSEIPSDAHWLIEQRFPDVEPAELQILLQMMRKNIRSPLTSSAGRLFDAVSAFLGLCTVSRTSGEAAIALQAAADTSVEDAYDFLVDDKPSILVLSLSAAFRSVVDEFRKHKPVAVIAARFHNTLARGIVAACDAIRQAESIDTVALSGGVFFNELLRDRTCTGLHDAGFTVLLPQRVSFGDANIALGQAAIALAQTEPNM